MLAGGNEAMQGLCKMLAGLLLASGQQYVLGRIKQRLNTLFSLYTNYILGTSGFGLIGLLDGQV